MERGEGVIDSNKTLLSDYLEDFEGLETPSESLRHAYNCIIYISFSCASCD